MIRKQRKTQKRNDTTRDETTNNCQRNFQIIKNTTNTYWALGTQLSEGPPYQVT